VAFEQSPACEGAEGDIPDPIVNFFEADIFAKADVGNVNPWMVPSDAPMGAAITDLEAIGVLKRWPCMRHLPGGGCIAGGGGTQVECFVRPLAVERLTEALDAWLWRAAGGRWGPGGFGFARPMPACRTAMLLGCARVDALGEDPESNPPG
jgi:hypothetical protein